jgi:hypothetical protein
VVSVWEGGHPVRNLADLPPLCTPFGSSAPAGSRGLVQADDPLAPWVVRSNG